MKLLLWLITVLYFAGGIWWYVTIHKQAGIALNSDMITEDLGKSLLEEPVDEEPYYFQWSDPKAILSPGFFAFRDSVARETGSNKLEITGQYYKDEVNPTQFKDLGMARADRIRHLFSEVLKPSQFVLGSEVVNLESDATGKTTARFKAIRLEILDKLSQDPEESITSIIINFPYASNDLLLDPETESVLKQLVARINTSGEQLLIVGHADNTAGEKRNTYLGYKRAQSVSEKFIALGVAREKIILESKGESEPIASNESLEGRKRNRRVEIFILPT
jgi:OOP family OmpA-OmpF porin